MMTELIKLKIITPTEIVFDGTANLVTMPGEEGEFGVLPHHMMLIANLKAGVVKIDINNSSVKYFISNGIAEVNCTPEEVNIIADYSADVTFKDRKQIEDELHSLTLKINNESDDKIKAIINIAIDRTKSLLDVIGK